MKNTFKDYFRLGEVGSYFLRLFRRHDSRYPLNLNIRMMHGINRISVVLFLLALVVMVTRCVVRSF